MKKLLEFLKSERLKIFLRLMTIISIVILIMLVVFYAILSRNKEEQAFQTSDLLIDQIKNVILANERSGEGRFALTVAPTNISRSVYGRSGILF